MNTFALCCSLFGLAAAASSKPNIVLFLTDDQDTLTDALSVMPKLARDIAHEGVSFDQAFTTTPVCCPSRSSIVTGRYIHNVGVTNNSLAGNCAGDAWQSGPEMDNFGQLMSAGGNYSSFYSGKYLNQYGERGTQQVPRGWAEWAGLVGNSQYYNYSLSVNGAAEKHGDNYTADYLPDVILKKALAFVDSHVNSENPLFMVLSFPSCHQTADPAPQYQGKFNDSHAPRTASWNVTSRDKHWFVSTDGVTGPLDENTAEFGDWLHRRRMATLLSVDDAIEAIVKKFEKQLDNTYFFYTSDHGYHIGQFGLALDKRLPYETDIKVPLFVRGPHTRRGGLGGRVADPVLLIDLAPTFLDLAGAPIPDNIDGQSFARTLRAPSSSSSSTNARRFLVEYHGETNNGGGQAASAVCPVRPGMNCYKNGDVPVPPHFDGEYFCSCQDASNNTYSCVRETDGASLNYLYCEFVSGFTELYNIAEDPAQLVNLAPHAGKAAMSVLHDQLRKLKACKGKSCSEHERRPLPGAQQIRDEFERISGTF